GEDCGGTEAAARQQDNRVRGRRRQALDSLAAPPYQRRPRDQLRGHVGTELGGEDLDVADRALRQPQHRGGVGAAAAEAGGDRDPLLDLDPQRRPVPAALAQRRQRSGGEVLALDPRADDLVAAGLGDLDRVGQGERLEQRAERVQAVVPAWAEEEAEVELGGSLDAHRGQDQPLPLAFHGRPWASSTNSSGVTASARVSRRSPNSGSKARVLPSVPGRAGASEGASVLRRWANAARTRLRVAGSAPGPVRRRAMTAEPTRGRGRKTEGSTERSVFVSQASCTSTLGAPYSRRPGSALRRSAISRCTITVQRCTEGSSSIVRMI